jgi:two-component sensor histidine kinase
MLLSILSEQELRLKKALEEKDYLMRELHHRIKNNLAMVSSLISLKDCEIEADLSDLKHRIDVITFVHEKLHQGNHVQTIATQEYFQELLDSLFSATTFRDIEIVNTIEAMRLPVKIAIPLGLIVNELATNALKHGFIPEKRAVFTLDLKRNATKGEYALQVSNTGKPFPEEVDVHTTDTLGLQLISILIHQLHGRLELVKRPFPVFTLTFPVGD